MNNVRKLYNYCDAVRDVMALQGRPIPEPIKAIRRVHLTDMSSLIWHAITMDREPNDTKVSKK